MEEEEEVGEESPTGLLSEREESVITRNKFNLLTTSYLPGIAATATLLLRGLRANRPTSG